MNTVVIIELKPLGICNSMIANQPCLPRFYLSAYYINQISQIVTETTPNHRATRELQPSTIKCATCFGVLLRNHTRNELGLLVRNDPGGLACLLQKMSHQMYRLV
ncbi:hypothetical protein CEXT_196711 [Caerostris extrusa]|uniref:Uncharacterized protein n=1 Tax=Caerostris extrusa TaxID=172846 RepID=A0AAV4MSG8_CAEEX|nr:hypothetical protein CEXT_196711 [Caerostris extrusa]